MTPETEPRFGLLIYPASTRWLTRAIWLIPGGILLGWVAWSVPELDSRLAPLALLISLAGVLLTAYAMLARAAHIRCKHDSFVIRTPLYPVAFSYQRVFTIRPVEFRSVFPPGSVKRPQRRFYDKLWGKTAVLVELKSFPLPQWWLRLWFHPFLLHPRESAIVLLVEDWMGLARSLESLRSQWRERANRRR